MSFIPKPHEIYKHFKGNLYQITAIAEHTETGEILVVYQAMYGDFKTYARPLSMFVGPVDKEKYPDVTQEFRFELQGPEAERQKRESGSVSGAAVTQSQPPASRQAQSDAERSPVSRQTRSGAVQSPVRPQTRSDADQSPVRPQTQSDADQQSVDQCSQQFQQEEQEEELNIDPMVLEFLDSDSYEQRLNILAGLHHRITDDMLTTMAIACDVEIGDGDIEERYEALKTCLLTLERYECNRLR